MSARGVGSLLDWLSSESAEIVDWLVRHPAETVTGAAVLTLVVVVVALGRR